MQERLSWRDWLYTHQSALNSALKSALNFKTSKRKKPESDLDCDIDDEKRKKWIITFIIKILNKDFLVRQISCIAPRLLLSGYSVRLDREIKSMLPDLIVIRGPYYVNKRLNTRPVLSKRDFVYIFFSTSLPLLFSRVYRLPVNLARNITTPVLRRALPDLIPLLIIVTKDVNTTQTLIR